ncbi:sodium:proton antiporter [Bacillus sp. AFS073361]|uniref:Na+/H+ antiporter NhaC family protein n=1 Tax=Bacillus sp. AFS073361 TaxID=2033511 RepID=UPI000BF7D856|nr:Na+/H+ antiporter NhaC family protein [Bacillus sp. AFS073361]PFP16099.1 sodium:proton antiporter [Bacillus sp. AFS073361]
MNIHFSLKQVSMLLIVTLTGVVWSVIFHHPLVIGFFPGYLVLTWLAARKNLRLKQILHISILGVNKTRIVILILFLVSFLLPSWYLAGTIQQMVEIALHFIVPNHFFVLSFLCALVFSMLLGTTVGTLSAIGIPIIGTAIVLKLPVELVAGALVSGAFVGDRTSPFSSAHQLLSHTVELPLKRQWKAMLFTTLAAIFLCFCFYGAADYLVSGTAGSKQQLVSWNDLSLIKFIPPSILIIFVLLRISIVYAFLTSILSAAAIALFSGSSWPKLVFSLWHGIEGLGGGFLHMYELLLFLALAGAYNGLLEEMNVIQPYLDRWLQSSRTLTGDTLKTMLATFLITLIAANQTLPIILTGRSFLPHWSNTYGKEELARVMGDSTMLFPGVVPWSVLAIMCSTIVGIPIMAYLPFALFLWILPILTILVSFVKQARKSKEKQTVIA